MAIFAQASGEVALAPGSQRFKILRPDPPPAPAPADCSEAPVGTDDEALLAQYAESRDPLIRDRIVAAYTRLVKRIAADFINAGVSGEDLIQVGFVGLLNAIEMFDAGRGNKFVTYATHLIRGEIRHYLRDYRDTIRKPRWLQKMNHSIDQAVASYVSEEGRFPATPEVAARLQVDEQGLRDVMKTREAMRTVPWEIDEETGEPRADSDRSYHESQNASQVAVEDRMLLFDAMQQLNAQQRRVLYYLYFNDLTQAEAAQRIGISQKHVSRLLAASLARLRATLSEAV